MITNNIPPTNELDIAYSNLYNAYMRRDRKAIESNCLNCHTLEIPNFHELAISSDVLQIQIEQNIHTCQSINI